MLHDTGHGTDMFHRTLEVTIRNTKSTSVPAHAARDHCVEYGKSSGWTRSRIICTVTLVAGSNSKMR